MTRVVEFEPLWTVCDLAVCLCWLVRFAVLCGRSPAMVR